MNRRHLVTIIFSCFLVALLGIANFTLAQDSTDPIAEPTEESTPPVVVEVTQEPTVETPTEVTAEPTLEPTVEATTEATAEPTSLPEPTLIPAPVDQFGDDFQDANTTGWILTSGWQLGSDSSGNVFLTASTPNEIALVDGVNWAHLLLSARLFITPGDMAALSVRSGAESYVIVLDAAGQASLYRSGVLVAQGMPVATIIDAAGAWRTLNLQVLGSLITVGVDGTVQFSFSDPAPLAEGSVSFSTGANNVGTLGLDDVTIIRLDAPVATPPPTEAPVLPTESPTPEQLPAEPPLSMLIASDFNSAVPADWTLAGNWTLVASENGQALQAAGQASATLANNVLLNAVIQARFLLESGSVQVSTQQSQVGGYTASLDAGGAVKLYRAGIEFASAAVTPSAPGQWRTLRLSSIGGVLRIAVDSVEVIAIRDSAMLPPGGTSFGGDGAFLADDVQVSVLTSEILPTPVAETSASAAQPQLIPEVNGQPLSLNGFGRKPTISNMTSDLNRLSNSWGISQNQALTDAIQMGLEISGNQILVTIIASDLPQADAIVNALPGLGAQVTARYQYWIDASIPVGVLAQVAALPGVNEVRPLIEVYPLQEEINNPPIPESLLREDGMTDFALPAGSVLTQGVAASKANTWHNAGWYGQGVKIGIIDSFQGYTTAQALGELPATVYTYGTLNLGSPHGTAVAEIIYDMAPQAILTLSSPTSAVDMANKIITLASQGNRIISSSMGYYNAEAGDGVGAVSSAIATAYASYGTLYVQAAGNQAQYNWQGNFRDGDNDRYMNFTSSASVEVNLLNKGALIPGGYPISLYLRWNDWNANRNGNASAQDYDLYLAQWTGSSWQIIASSEGDQSIASLTPTEQIGVYTPATGYYGFLVYRYSATGNAVIDVMGHNAPSFKQNIASLSLVDPATSAYSFSVAALNRTSPYALEPYSSRGRTMGPGGTLAAGLQQPWISGYANVNTWAYGPNAFNGTSSATPHVAGAAALVWSAYPAYGPGDVRNFLQNRAVDMGTAGYDATYGRGRLNLGTPPVFPGPQLVSPVNGANTNDSTPLFTWNAASFGGGSTPTGYYIEIDNNSNFATPERWGTIGGLTAVVTSALPDGLYYWRVRAMNGSAGGKWSSVRNFRVDTIPPSAPILKSPVNGASMTNTRPTLSWQTASGAVRYQVYVDNNSDFSSPLVNQSTTALSLRVPSALPPGTYYWYIAAVDGANNFQSSLGRVFTVTS